MSSILEKLGIEEVDQIIFLNNYRVMFNEVKALRSYAKSLGEIELEGDFCDRCKEVAQALKKELREDPINAYLLIQSKRGCRGLPDYEKLIMDFKDWLLSIS
jgi:hypothetical protein